jgi:excisionase family DNA binding protein
MNPSPQTERAICLPASNHDKEEGVNIMYLTIKETAEFLNMPESAVESLILQKRIRAIHDGERYLINKEQFNTHLEQVEKYKKLVEEMLNEPIPEDLDVKDED